MDWNGIKVVGSQPAVGASLALDAPGTPVGSFRYGGVFDGRPRVLGTWLVTSSDTSILGRVAELLGGTRPKTHGPDQEPYVITDATEIDVNLTGPGGPVTAVVLVCGFASGSGKALSWGRSPSPAATGRLLSRQAVRWPPCAATFARRAHG